MPGVATPSRPRELQRLRRRVLRLRGRRDIENSPVPCFSRAKVPSALALLRGAERAVQGGSHRFSGGALLLATPGLHCRAGTAAGLIRQHSRAGCPAARPRKSQTAARIRPHGG
ncbi:hypothetical protein NN561_009034 [Cricetulus griseus]